MMDEIQNTEPRHMTSEIKTEQSVVSSDEKISPLNKGSTGKRRFHHKSKNGCDHCKRRRVKCSMEKPFCHNCLHMNLDCIYSPVQPRKKKAKVISSKDIDIDTSTTPATTIKNSSLKSGESENEKQNSTSDMSYDGSDQSKGTRNKTIGCDNLNLKLNDSKVTAKKVIKKASKTTKNSSTATTARKSKTKQESKTGITLDKNKNNKIKADTNNKLCTLKYTVVKPDGTKVTIEEISNSAAIESLKNEFAGQQSHGANAHPHYYQQHDASGLLLPPLMPPGAFQQQQQAPHLLPQLMTLTNSEKFVANEYPLNTLLNSPQSTGMNLTNSIGTFFSLNNAKMLTNLTAKSNTVSTPSSSLATGDGINIKSEKKPVPNSSKLLRTPVSASTTLAGSKIMSTPGMFQPAGIGGITYDFHELLGSKLTGSNLDHLNNIIETETDTQSNSERKPRTKLKIMDPNTNFPSLNSSRSVSSEGFPNENNADLHLVSDKRKNSIDNLESSNLNSSESSHQQSTLTQIQQEAKDEAAEVLSTMASVAQRDKNNSSVNNYNKRPHKKPLIPQLLEIQSRSGSTGGGNLNLIDLKLFQHYNNVVCDTIVQAGISNHDIWFHEIPNLAFQYPFLMHSLLAFTATHLARTEVGLERIVASHRLDALRLLREAVLHITPENTDALVASSIILIMDSLANAASPVENNESESKNDTASELSRHLQNVSDRPITEGSMMDPDMIRKAMGAAAASLGTSGANMLNSIPSMIANMAGGAALATNLSTSAWIFHVKGAATILTAVWPLPETSKFYNLINVDLSELGNLLSSPVAMSSSQTGSEHADEMSTGIQYENNDHANEKRNGKASMIQSTITDLVCFDDSIADLYPVEIDSPYLITLAYLDKLNKEKNKDGFILRIFAFPALLDKTFLALLMTGDLNAMRIMRCYYKMLRGFASEYKDKIWFLEGITQVLPVDVDEYSGGGVYMMLDFLGNGLPSMNTTNFDTQQPWTL